MAAMIDLLAVTLRNVAIYPANHPRVVGAAKELTASLRQKSEGLTTMIYTAGERLVFDRVPIPANDSKAAWLLQRFREAAVRGIEFTHDCSAEDLIGFAQALQTTQTRRGTAIAALWPSNHARLRAFDLVYAGFHGEREFDPTLASGAYAAGDAVGEGQVVSNPHETKTAQKQSRVLSRLANDDGLTEQLEAIQAACSDTEDGPQRRVDLLTAITELMPVDLTADPEQAAHVAHEILARIQRDMREMARPNAQVRGAELLRRALAVARKYFVAEAPRALPEHDLPSGRPEDEGITADLAALQAELAALPDSDQDLLPPASEFAPDAIGMARQLLGIYLHLFTHTERAHVVAALKPILTRQLTSQDERFFDVLDDYLRPRSDEHAITEIARRRLLHFLADIGKLPFLRGRAYIDAQFLTRGFPESLPLAARALGSDAAGLKVFQQGLQALAPVLAIGGVQAAAAAGVLADEAVVAALAAIGGEAVLPLLVHAAASSTSAVRGHLIAYARTRELPLPEKALLDEPTAPPLLTSDYVRELYSALVRKRVPPALRVITGSLLCTVVERGLDSMPTDALLTAIDNLRHAPTPTTVALLTQLATQGRFTTFHARARAIRRSARAALAAMPQGDPL
jgi:hypothetical protein